MRPSGPQSAGLGRAAASSWGADTGTGTTHSGPSCRCSRNAGRPRAVRHPRVAREAGPHQRSQRRHWRPWSAGFTRIPRRARPPRHHRFSRVHRKSGKCASPRHHSPLRSRAGCGLTSAAVPAVRGQLQSWGPRVTGGDTVLRPAPSAICVAPAARPALRMEPGVHALPWGLGKNTALAV